MYIYVNSIFCVILDAYMYHICISGLRGQKMASDHLNLEIEAIVSCPMGAGN